MAFYRLHPYSLVTQIVSSQIGFPAKKLDYTLVTLTSLSLVLTNSLALNCIFLKKPTVSIRKILEEVYNKKKN